VLSRYGLIAYASSLDTPGIFARTIDDIALMFGIGIAQSINQPTNQSTNQSIKHSTILDH